MLGDFTHWARACCTAEPRWLALKGARPAQVPANLALKTVQAGLMRLMDWKQNSLDETPRQEHKSAKKFVRNQENLTLYEVWGFL